MHARPHAHTRVSLSGKSPLCFHVQYRHRESVVERPLRQSGQDKGADYYSAIRRYAEHLARNVWSHNSAGWRYRIGLALRVLMDIGKKTVEQAHKNKTKVINEKTLGELKKQSSKEILDCV